MGSDGFIVDPTAPMYFEMRCYKCGRPIDMDDCPILDRPAPIVLLSQGETRPGMSHGPYYGCRPDLTAYITGDRALAAIESGLR